MDTSSQKSANDLTRRQFLHHSGKVALVASLAGFASPLVRPMRAASSSNSTLVEISQTGAAPDKALPKALKEFEAANPGVTTKLVLYPEEKFVAMYTAAQTAGEQADLPGLILPYTAGSLPLAIFLLKTYFDQLPSELMDAARLDGCSNRMILLTVVLPLSRPVLSTVTIFTFVQAWNEFFLALVFIHNPDLQTLPLGLQAFFVNQYETQFPQLFATLALSIAPVVIVYLFLQKQFIAGLTAGAVKA
jgi:Binding-protein-dependent transport system inner membrane component